MWQQGGKHSLSLLLFIRAQILYLSLPLIKNWSASISIITHPHDTHMTPTWHTLTLGFKIHLLTGNPWCVGPSLHVALITGAHRFPHIKEADLNYAHIWHDPSEAWCPYRCTQCWWRCLLGHTHWRRTKTIVKITQLLIPPPFSPSLLSSHSKTTHTDFSPVINFSTMHIFL